MRKLLVLLITACLLAAGLVQATPPQQQATPAPIITAFTSAATRVDPTALNNRMARVPVSWTTSNRPNSANLVFEQVLPDGRVINVELPRDNPWVASNGSGVAAPIAPGGNATSIILRVRLIDVVKIVVWDEETLTIPIGVVTAPTPVIRSFTTTATAVLRSELENKTARVPVAWQVDDRPNTANLVFEQVLANGSSVNVELPRQNPYVASSGIGVAASVVPGDNAVTGVALGITLRLRVIDLATGQTLTQQDISLPITNTVPTPAITTFTTTATSVTRAALNNKTARVPVTWATANRPANSNLVFEQVLDNGTVVNVELPRQNPYVASSGNGMAAPVNPGTSASIKLQVRLIDLSSQNTLIKSELNVTIVEGGNTAKIAFFTTSTAVVDWATLNNKTARIPVSWSVDNRPNGSNLVFEQVLANGSSVNVELPRQNPYVASSGNGVAAPVAPGGSMSIVQLRLRLINLSDSSTLDSKDITVPINGLPNQSPQIVAFTTSPTTAAPGGQVTLAWEVKNATAISISPLPASVNAAIANQMTGTTTVSIPINASGTVTIELIARNAAGQETRGAVSISIIAPPQPACQFPTSLADTCPQTQETVNAAYQLFEQGHMIWNGNTQTIYVLFPDGHWEAFADTWQPGDPDPVAGDLPEGLIVPVRGFGKIWEQIGGAPVLGFATAAEQSYSATWETHPLLDGGQTAYTPHFTLPDGRVGHLEMQWTIE